MRGVVLRWVHSRRHHCLSASRVVWQISHGRRPGPLCFNESPHAQHRAFQSLCKNLDSDPSFLSSDIDVGFVRPEQTEKAILDRAKVHGIETWDELAFQADFRRDQIPGKRLVDDIAIRQDLDLWAVLLDYRQMKDGSHGIRQVFVAMLSTDQPVKLYADSVSEHIWHTILPVLLEEEKLLYELCQIGSAFIKDRPFVFGDIVGRLLAMGNVRLAIVLGTQLLSSHFRGRLDLLHLFDITFQLNTENALENLCELISRLPRYRIYADTVPKMWIAGRNKHAFVLHKHLLTLGDYPAEFEQLEPFVRALAAKNVELQPFVRDLESYGISFTHQARRFYVQERARLVSQSRRPSNFSIQLGPGTRPVKLSDAFVARTFATRSVSFDFVLNGLIFIGLFEIGPLAVRELAIAARNIDDLKKRFHQLDSMAIDLGSSTYVRVVRNLCMSGEKELLQGLLQSDMHYEVLEDFQKQKRLLTEYLHQSNRKEINRTLAILNAGKVGIEAELTSARLMLHNTLLDGDWRRALMVVDEIRDMHQSSGKRSDLAPLRFALHRIWAGINSQSVSDNSYLAHPQYLVGFMQSASAAGLPVYPWQWRSVLHAVGRCGDWALFCKLLFSIARLVSDDPQKLFDRQQNKAPSSLSAMDKFFDSALQCFVIEVSLTATAENQDPQQLWLRGVKLLLDLQDCFQTSVNYESVSSAFENRLQKLFSGVELGARARFIRVYLDCLKWAWLKHGSSQTKDYSHNHQGTAFSIPDRSSLRLFQFRSRLVKRHRNPVEIEDIAGNDEELVHLTDRVQNGDTGFRKQTRSTALDVNLLNQYVEEQDTNTVYYEDLLHPSYKKFGSVQEM